MRRRPLPLLASLFLLCAASEPQEAPAPLQPYIEDGRFEPGDYAWMKGRFEDATPQERQDYKAIMQWHADCRAVAIAGLRARLAATGYPKPDLERLPLSPQHCFHFNQPNLPDNASFAAFEQDAAAATPIADTYLAVVGMAEEFARPRAEDLGRRLEARTLGEQLVRNGFTWGLGLAPDSPDLTPGGRAIFQSRIASAMGSLDHANTQWLKGIVAEHGWPKISEVGPAAASAAWLLVQHADTDPLFQLEVLRLMEPLVAQGEVSKSNYASLYDRIMLKLAGKQRYATQVLCDGDERRPMPLEDETAVDRLRAEMELGTVDEYIEMMDRNVGTCEELARGNMR